MSQSGLLAKGARWCRSIGKAVLPLILLFTRLAVGFEMFKDGLGKWQHLEEKVVPYFTSLGIPMPEANAYLVSTVELLFGIALFIGLATRFSALVLSCTMLVAMLTAHRLQFLDWIKYGDTNLTDMTALPYLMLMLWLLAMGAGPVSVDHFLAKQGGAKSGR